MKACLLVFAYRNVNFAHAPHLKSVPDYQIKYYKIVDNAKIAKTMTFSCFIQEKCLPFAFNENHLEGCEYVMLIKLC